MARRFPNLGDRIVAIVPVGYRKGTIGVIGTIVELMPQCDAIGVEFDTHVRGHSCDGKARYGHGWYLYGEQWDYCEQTKRESTISFDDFI